MITLCKRLWRFILVRSAIRHADKMRKLTNKQHYVIQVANRIRVYDRIKINRLIDMGILRKELREAYCLRKFCIYYTR